MIIRGTPQGARCYLAVSGGIDRPSGTRLSKGQILPVRQPPLISTSSAILYAPPTFSDPVELRYTSNTPHPDLIYDVTNGAHTQKISTENFMNRGDRVIFNAVTFDKEDLEGNKKYMFVIESKHRAIASSTFILKQEGEHYSGKVSFSDEETKK